LLAVALCVFALVFGFEARCTDNASLKRLCVGFAASALIAWLWAESQENVWGAALLRLMIWQPWPNMFLAGTLAFFWARLLLRGKTAAGRDQWCGWGWVFLTYLPAVRIPYPPANLGHMHYLVAVGWSVWLCYALADIARALVRRIASLTHPQDKPALSLP
jgi:hypothetical protein